jgi:hypothetical protein
MRVHLKRCYQDGSLLILEVPATAKVADLRAILSRQERLFPNTVRFVFNRQQIHDDVPSSSSAAAPISVFAKPEPPLNPAIAPLVELGYPPDQCEIALRRAQGNPEIAAHLLLQPATMPSDPYLFGVTSNPQVVASLLECGTASVCVSGQRGVEPALVNRQRIDGLLNGAFGVDLATFVSTGGWRRYCPQALAQQNPLVWAVLPCEKQEKLNRLWMEKFETFGGSDKEKVRRIAGTLSVGLAEVVQAFVVAGRDEAKTIGLLRPT